MNTFPKARQEKLIVTEFGDEVLIYDQRRHQAHCLNQTAALVWKQCDGRTSVSEITARLAIDEKLVWYALEQFERDLLLTEKVEVPAGMLTGGGMNRRQVMRALGVAAVVAVPLVTSMVAPTAAQAATCRAAGAACSSSAQCCSGICQANNTCV